MSNEMRNIVELTQIKGLSMASKCILIHMADTARKELLFWRSNIKTSQCLGTDEKTVRRNLKKLVDLGLITWVGERLTNSSPVAVYRIEVDVILALPCIEKKDQRAKLAKDLVRGSEPWGEGFIARGLGVESPTNQSHPLENHSSAEKSEIRSEVIDYAHEDEMARVHREWLRQQAEDDARWEGRHG